MSKMTDVEKQQWDTLYRYVKKEILLYNDAQSIPSDLVLRLKGLTKGKYIENKKIEDRADYSYETILYTFQICKPQIMSAINNRTFNNEKMKFNYICKIVENNINDVYIRLEKVKRADEDIQSLDTGILSHDGADYKKKTENLKNTRLDELW